ncbi:MAG TPA: DegT/DnrJ/EryC1/StrS family aminotransferase [Herpetosiphonaceae bacterium]
MIPRGTPDIGWLDLLAGLGYGLLPDTRSRAQAVVEGRWSPHRDTLACLSVRSGFDLLLHVLALPVGTEVLVSAITIPDMIQLLVHHGLVPIPVDLDPDTLAVDPTKIHQLVSPRTKAILVAHLFGSRMPLDQLIEVAQQHSLLVIEDCAQAYDASSYRGHAQSDISMFSFGPIKMQTALGAALLRVRDRSLLARLRQRQAGYPRQSRLMFMQRVARFMVLKLLARPWLFALLIALCRLRGIDHDALLNQATRGFSGTDLIGRLRQQPCAPLLRLLDRRLRYADPRRIRHRAQVLSSMVRQHPPLKHPGAGARQHTQWVIPVESRDPDRLVHLLQAHGFDATRKASRLVVVPPPQQRPRVTTPHAERMVRQLVYLPVAPAMSHAAIARVRQIILDFEHRYTDAAGTMAAAPPDAAIDRAEQATLPGDARSPRR